MPKIYGNSEIWGDLLVTGSFSILGSASTIYSTSLVVSDTIISLGHSQSSPLLDEGIMFSRGTGLTQALIWDESDDTFALIGTNDDHTLMGDININSYSNLRVGGLTTSNLRITSGASAGYFLQSDSFGNGSWTSFSSGGGLTGSGTNNYLAKWTSTGSLTNSIIYDISGVIGINSYSTQHSLGVYSNNEIDTISAVNSNLTTTSKRAFSGSISGNGNSTSNYGIRLTVQDASNSNFSIYANTTGASGSNNYGAFILNDSSGTNNYGIYVDSHNATNNYGLVVNKGSSVFNESGDNYDFRVEGESDQNLFFADASVDNIGIGTNTPLYKLSVSSTVSTTGFRMTNGASAGYIIQSDSDGDASWNSPIISDTYANIQSLSLSGDLMTGWRYYITDKKIWVDALSGSTFSSSALRQQTILDSTAYTGSTLGVWNSTLTPIIGDKAIWGGKLWQNVNGLTGSYIDMYDLDSEWTLLTSDPLYVEKIFTIEYNFSTDRISIQSDDKGNIVKVDYDGYDDFTLITDWGMPYMYNNTSLGIFNNVSNTINGNVLYGFISLNKVNSILRNHGGIITQNECNEISSNKFNVISYNQIPSEIRENNVSDIYNNTNNGYIRYNNANRIYGNSNSGSILSNNCVIIFNNSNSGAITNNDGVTIWANSNNGYIEHNTSFSTIQYNSNGDNIYKNNANRINSNQNTGEITCNISDIETIGTYSTHIRYKTYNVYDSIVTTDSSTQSVSLLDPSSFDPILSFSDHTLVQVEVKIIAKSYDSSNSYYSEIKGLFNTSTNLQVGSTNFSENKDFISATTSFSTYTSGILELYLIGESSTDIIWDIGINYTTM